MEDIPFIVCLYNKAVKVLNNRKNLLFKDV